MGKHEMFQKPNCMYLCFYNILYRIMEDSLSFVGVGMVCRTTLKPYASLCDLFFIFLFLNYYYLCQNFCWHNNWY